MSAIAGRAPVRSATRLGAFEKGAIALLLLAALSPAAPTTAVGLVNPSSYTNAWTLRLGGGPNVVELGLLVLAAVWVGSGTAWRGRSALDRAVAWFALLVAGLQLLALARNGSGIEFMPLDVERVLLLVAGYLVVTRMDIGTDWAKRVAFLTAGALAVSFCWVTLRHGIVGSTEFGTVSGGKALLITEDSLLVIVPVVLGWGLVVDRIAGSRLIQGVVAFIAAAVVVDFLSLRRGGLIFVIGATLVRTLWAPRRWIIGGLGVALVAATIGIAAGPARPLVDRVTYVVNSSLLRSSDRSTGQRKAELDNFARNVHGPADVVLGRGLGAVWNAEASSAVDVASFGSGETEFVRVGWHVYGLDWLYKLGVLGVLAGLFVVGSHALQVRRRLRDLDDPVMRSLLRSLAVVAPVLVLFTFTNPRVALFAGAILGLGSKLLDLARPAPA